MAYGSGYLTFGCSLKRGRRAWESPAGAGVMKRLGDIYPYVSDKRHPLQLPGVWGGWGGRGVCVRDGGATWLKLLANTACRETL